MTDEDTARAASKEVGGNLTKAPISSLPLKTRLGFVAAIVAVAAICLLSYRSLAARSAAAMRMSSAMTALSQLEKLQIAIEDAETSQRGFLLTGEERYLEPYAASVRSLPVELTATRSAIAAFPAQSARMDLVDRLTQEKLAELKATIDLRRKGDRDGALSIVAADHGKDAMDRLRATLGDMKAFERTQLDARTQEWSDATTYSAIVTWGGSGLLLFLIVTALVISTKDFREQQIQIWMRTGQGALAGVSQGNQSLQALGENVASFLARYVGAQVGVVYFDDGAAELTRLGGYALSDGPKSATGLTKQVYKDNDVLQVDDVPEEYFSVASGLGRGKPRHLVLAPTTADGEPNGVIELGFMDPVSNEALELLRRSGALIGAALRSAKYRRDVEDLLEETKRQAEELQTQQEELRVNNEELEQQSRALQASQEQLKNQQAELEQINSQLEEQAASVERQRDELLRAQGELKRASAYKSEFLANMSHELRTPLNSSLILAKLLADNRDENLTAEQVKFAETIYSAGNDLLTLINDILDLSKIEAGKLDVRSEAVPLQRLVDDLSNTFAPVAAEKHLELDASIDPRAPAVVETDPARVLQILKNLLSNALKFTDRGKVSLRVYKPREGKISFAVEDTGIGIAREDQDVIFEAFRQADGTTNRKYGGTGLGLSISRDLARLLGGELVVVSAPGKGSTFTLTLPERYRAPQQPAMALEPAMPAPPAKRERRIPAANPALHDDRDSIDGAKRTILIVEDDVAFARILQDLSRELDFKTLLAGTAEEGLALASSFRPNAIVLDVNLPDRSGLSVLDALKHDPATRHIPVHMMSVADYSQEALGMGAAGYAVKPVLREALVDALKKLETKFTQKLRRILVVEDDVVHRESTCSLLATNDVECVPVGTAEDALAQLKTSTFDCMVLDLSLPDKSGVTLLEEMSKEQRSSFPPVIVYTGRSLSRVEEDELRRFSQSIIVKGARSPERLLDEVTLFLHQVEAEMPADRQRMLRDARHREHVFEGKRVLVVEDDVRNIFALSSVLEPRGAKVEIARNGREALEHLKEKPGVDLVLMDIMMPEMDGLEATRAIRKQPELGKLPIIALTAKAMADDRDSCLAAGANDYIAKPLDVDKLLSLARVWLPK